MKLHNLKPQLATINTMIAGVIATPRQRGSGWMSRRAKLLKANPLCCLCEEEGRTTMAVEVDHIVPLFIGGADSDSNTQNLCKPCHDAKTKVDLAGAGGRGG